MTILASKGSRVGACRHLDRGNLAHVHVIKFLDGPAVMSRIPEAEIGTDTMGRDVTLDCMLLCDECVAAYPVGEKENEEGEIAPIDQDFVLDYDIYEQEVN